MNDLLADPRVLVECWVRKGNGALSLSHLVCSYDDSALVIGRRPFNDTSIHLPKPKGGVSAGQFESYTQVVVETP